MKIFKEFLKKMILILLICFVIGFVSTSAYAEKKFYGDTGLPEDYGETIKDLKKLDRYRQIMAVLPASFNWSDEGKVTPAKSQAGCGSCWAFAAVGVLESRILIATDAEYDLSEQQQVSCNFAMNGCSGGNLTALQFWYDLGPMQESCASYCACDTKTCYDIGTCAQLNYNTADYYAVDVASIDDMKSSIYTDGPGMFRFTVYSDFETYWDSGAPGSVYTQTSGTKVGGHAILLIGWDDNQGAWICKNSWGKNAGPNKDGTFRIAYTGHAQNLKFGLANIQNLILKEVQKIACCNNAGFVMGFKVGYIDDDGNEKVSTTDSGTFPINNWKTIDLANLDPAISEGTVVWPIVNAKGGKTIKGDMRILYKDNNQVATYMVKGTTQSYSVTESGESVVNPYIPMLKPAPGPTAAAKTGTTLKEVQKICCGNNAGFVMYFKVAYIDSEGNEQESTTSSNKYPINNWRTIDLSTLTPAISEGTTVWPKVKAIAGKTKSPDIKVVYKKNNQVATYIVKGTTLSYSITEDGESVVNESKKK